MNNDIIVNNLMIMLNNSNFSLEQLTMIKLSLNLELSKYNIEEKVTSLAKYNNKTNQDIAKMFLISKKIEGKADSTIKAYGTELRKFFTYINKDLLDIKTDDIRAYLAYNKIERKVSNTTLSNIRLYLKSFFKYCKNEEYIFSNPMDRIEAIKCEEKVRPILSSEQIELLRCNCTSKRDIAIIDLLRSTGIRVSELVKLNINDINFTKSECIVKGKGSRERYVFFDGRTKVHLMEYVNSRKDGNIALFVSKNKKCNRLSTDGIRYILNNIKTKSNETKHIKLHPHTYRYSLASNLLNQNCEPTVIQAILGHKYLDTTMKIYASYSKNTIHNSYNCYMN